RQSRFERERRHSRNLRTWSGLFLVGLRRLRRIQPYSARAGKDRHEVSHSVQTGGRDATPPFEISRLPTGQIETHDRRNLPVSKKMNDSKPSLKSKPKPANLSWKGKLILVAASVLFTCAVMEVGLRVAAAIDQRRAKAIS